MNIDAKEEGEQGHDDHAAAQAGERAEKSGGERTEGHEGGEVEGVHSLLDQSEQL
jgi:hypothetical protein